MKASFLLLFLFLKVATSDVLEKFRANNLLLTYRLFWKHFSPLEGNFLFSPVAIQTLLALAAVGAEGNTAHQLHQIGYLPTDMATLTEMIEAVQKTLSESPTLSMYNEIFIGANALNSRYENIAQSIFKAVIRRNKPKRVDSTTLSSNVLVLSHGIAITSNLVMNASWVSELLPYSSLMAFLHRIMKFSNTEMISTTTPAYFLLDTAMDSYNIEFPFVDKDLSLTLVLPREPVDYPSLELGFPRIFYVPKSYYKKVLLQIALPKIWVQHLGDLVPVLKILGVTDAFSENADFSGIGDFPLQIEMGVHGSYFNISAIPVDNRPVRIGFPKSEMVVARSFMYYLRHKLLGLLMVGRFIEPTVKVLGTSRAQAHLAREIQQFLRKQK